MPPVPPTLLFLALAFSFSLSSTVIVVKALFLKKGVGDDKPNAAKGGDGASTSRRGRLHARLTPRRTTPLDDAILWYFQGLSQKVVPGLQAATFL